MPSSKKSKKSSKTRTKNVKKLSKIKKGQTKTRKQIEIKRDAPKKTRPQKTKKGIESKAIRVIKKIKTSKIKKALGKKTVRVGKSMSKVKVSKLKAKIEKKIAKGEKKAEKKTKKSKTKMNALWCKVLLKDAMMRRWLINSVGEHAIHVIQEFEKEMSDEDIAKKSEIRPSDVRVVLNKMHSYGLATYSRNKDKKSGWYSYVWVLHEDRAKELYETMKKKFEEVKAVAKKEGDEYYYCVVGGKKEIYNFEQAMELNFKCPNTGQSMKFLEQK